jgi:hypothetical protein
MRGLLSSCSTAHGPIQQAEKGDLYSHQSASIKSSTIAARNRSAGKNASFKPEDD